MLVPIFQAFGISDSPFWGADVGTVTRSGQINPTAATSWPINQSVVDKLVDFTSIRQTYRSTTYTLNTNELTNKGTCTVAAFRPNVFTISVNGSAYHSEHNLSKYKNIKEFIGNAQLLYAEQSAYATKHQIALNDATLPVRRPTPYVVTDILIQVVSLGHGIRDISDITLSSPGFTSTPAKEGAFVRSFPTQPVNLYKSTEVTAGSGRITNLMFCAYTTRNNAGDWYLNYFVDRTGGDFTKVDQAIQDLPWSDFQWHYVWFDNLDAASFVNAKTIQGFEVQPVQGSLFCPLMRVPAPADNAALESLSIVTNMCPDSLPARYNEGGEKAAAAASASGADKEAIDALKGEAVEINSADKMVEHSGGGRHSTREKTKTPAVQSRSRPRTPKYTANTRSRSAPPRPPSHQGGGGRVRNAGGAGRGPGPNHQHNRAPPPLKELTTALRKTHNKEGKVIRKIDKRTPA